MEATLVEQTDNGAVYQTSEPYVLVLEGEQLVLDHVVAKPIEDGVELFPCQPGGAVITNKPLHDDDVTAAVAVLLDQQ